MEKYGNKTPLMKFVNKNTGYIVAAGFIICVVTVWFSITDEQEFFEKWSCGNLEWYVLTYNQEIYKQDFPDHNHLTEEQHLKFHEVISECEFMFEHK